MKHGGGVFTAIRATQSDMTQSDAENAKGHGGGVGGIFKRKRKRNLEKVSADRNKVQTWKTLKKIGSIYKPDYLISMQPSKSQDTNARFSSPDCFSTSPDPLDVFSVR